MTLSRRQILKTVATGIFAIPFLPRVLSAAELTKLTLQLNWIPNAEYSPYWIGIENGIFADEGIDLTVSAGGPNAPSPLVMAAAGEVELGIGVWLPFIDAVNKGNDFVLFCAMLQSGPLGILSLAKRPILTHEDIVGAKILAQGPQEKAMVEAALALKGLPNDWTMVPTGYSPEPLVAGDGDGYTAFAFNQTLTLEAMGLVRDKDYFFRTFNDLGLPTYSDMVFTTREYLTNNRPVIVSFVRGLIKSMLENEKDPSVGPRLTVEKYGADLSLDLQQQLRLNELALPFARPGGDPNFRIATMNRELMVGPMYDAVRATGRTNLPDIDQIVDFSIAEEAFDSV